MLRWDIINWLIIEYGYEDYLELGSTGRLDNPEHNFNKIIAANKTGVDAKGDPDFKMTTDEFFRQLPPDTKYDIVFIDAEHIAETVTRDIDNSLIHLRDNGAIVLHDCNPPTQQHSVILEEDAPYKIGADGRGYYVWCGTVWRAFVMKRLFNKDLTCRCVDTDWGCGIMQRGQWIPFEGQIYSEDATMEHLTYQLMAANRANYLNLITVDEFKEIYNGTD